MHGQADGVKETTRDGTTTMCFNMVSVGQTRKGDGGVMYTALPGFSWNRYWIRRHAKEVVTNKS